MFRRVERGLQGPRMARNGSHRGFAALGFLALGGGFAAAAYAVMQPPPPAPFAPPAAMAPAPDEGLMQVYVPLEEQVAVAVAEQPRRVMLDLAFSVRASGEELLALKAAVEAKKPAILAALLAAAQVEVARTAEPAVLTRALPGPLRMAVNAILGTPDRPAPVEEVLVTGLVTQ